MSHAFIPLHFKAGDALQFDWSEEHVVVGGVDQNIKVASEFKIMDIQMEINPNVKELHNYLKKNGLI